VAGVDGTFQLLAKIWRMRRLDVRGGQFGSFGSIPNAGCRSGGRDIGGELASAPEATIPMVVAITTKAAAAATARVYVADSCFHPLAPRPESPAYRVAGIPMCSACGSSGAAACDAGPG